MDNAWISVADGLPELPDVCICETFVIAYNEGDPNTRPMMYARRMVRGQTVEKWLTVGGGETYRIPDYWQPFPSTATAPTAPAARRIKSKRNEWGIFAEAGKSPE